MLFRSTLRSVAAAAPNLGERRRGAERAVVHPPTDVGVRGEGGEGVLLERFGGFGDARSPCRVVGVQYDSAKGVPH